MSRRFSIMAALNVIQPCSDVSDIIPLFPQLGFYLKPIAKLNISVHLPTLKLPGKTISNYEVMEKLKYWTIPDEFTSLKVSKNTLEFLRFEAEIESRSKLPAVLARLDGRFIKLSGFTESLKVRAAEAKCDFPTRHNWDSYFRDAKNMNEMKPGERPDTIHITNLPCKWFASKSNPDKPSEYILRKVFETFGEVRCVDIPSIDPYRTRMKAHISGIKMFSYHQNVVFEGYIQFKEYVFFMKAMDSLRGMKLIYKDDTKIFSASIKVDFDKAKHLSDSIIKKRRNEREKMMAEEREREEQERLKKEKEEAEKETERKRKLKEKEEKLARRKQREEKRKHKQLEKLKLKEADDMNRKIASEERLLLMAQRRLESIRLLSELLKRVEDATLKKIEEKQQIEKIMKKDKGKKGSKHVKLKLLAHQEEEELRRKLIEKLKSNDSIKSSTKEDTEPGSSKAQHILASSVSGTVPVSSASEGVSSLITSSESDMSDNDNTTNRGAKVEQPFPENYRGMGRTSGMPWYPHHRNAAIGFNPYSMVGNTFGRPHRPYYPRGRRGFRWPRYPGRGRGGYMPRYIDPLVLDINHQYYKYFHKLTHGRTSRSPRSNSYSRSRSRSRDNRHRSRTRSRSYSRRYSRSRSHSWSPSRSRSRSRSLGHRPSHRSRRRSKRSCSSSYQSDRSRNYSRHRSKSRSNSYDTSKVSHSRSKNKSPLQEKQRQSSESRYKRPDSRSGSESKEKSGRKKTRWDTDVTIDNKNDSKCSLNDLDNVSNYSDKSIKRRHDLGKRNCKSEADSTKNDIGDKQKRSPVRFPSLTHTWSRSPSPARSLSWEKKETMDNKGKDCYDGKNSSVDCKNQNNKHKKEGKKHKKKKKHRVKEK